MNNCKLERGGNVKVLLIRTKFSGELGREEECRGKFSGEPGTEEECGEETDRRREDDGKEGSSE